MVPVHQAAGVLQARRVVMLGQAAVARQSGRERLPSAVHGDLVDVGVNDQVGLRGALVDLEDLALVGVADHGEVVGVLGVVLVEEPLGKERIDDAVAEHMAQLVLVHPAVQTQRRNDVHVVDAGFGRHVEDGFDDALAVVRSLHFGSDRLASSKQIVSFMSGFSSSGSGSMSSGSNSASRMCPSRLSRPANGSGG